MSWKDPRTWSALGAFLLVIVLASVAVDFRSSGRGHQRQREQVEACERDNALRGYLLLRARDVPTGTANVAPKLFALLNCYETVHHVGHARTLAPRQSERYLRILLKARMPLVSPEGLVIGSRALPKAD
jgi:hypothetical protein